MQNTAIAIECGSCGVPIDAVLHPAPDTLISCQSCGASDSYEHVRNACFADVQAQFRKAIDPSAERPATKWKFRDLNRTPA